MAMYDDALFQLLTESADHVEEYGLTADLQRLDENGALIACLPKKFGGRNWAFTNNEEETKESFSFLRRLGKANLSLARLFEGHLHAVRLVHLHANNRLRKNIFHKVKDGTLLGVWGASFNQPLKFSRLQNGKIRLHGEKRLVTGLGLVEFAIVRCHEIADEADQLALVEVNDSARQSIEYWDASGMRPTLTGSFDFSGIEIKESDLLGNPGDFYSEPHYIGGVWRHSVTHLGGAEAIIDTWRDMLAKKDRLQDPFQLTRLAKARSETLAASAMLFKTACLVDDASRHPTEQNVDDAVLACLLAHNQMEDVCARILALCEKSLGMEAFIERRPIERMRRDLSMFIRHIAPDSRLLQAAELLVKRKGAPLW
ncbi:acyl-CoA dehydrogenase [uncultured Bartonella sp.]|uniref:acyl-CoA dehydrogenase n=1 Tax=uncultured Bartonella sp. TaxID=104108 RepID=UPI00263661D9|nr:acyl-CoA dehydrogenase [uncultured Bartonella sp.]